MIAAVALFKLIVLVTTILWLGYGVWRGWPMARGDQGSRFFLALALMALFAYPNFGKFHNPGYIHNAEFFHYYLSAKYFEEIGYDGLYAAALYSDAHSPSPSFGYVRVGRDLSTSRITGADDLRQDRATRERFLSARWKDFERDLAFFKPRSPQTSWIQAFKDHGYNAPPTLTIILRPIVDLLGTARRASTFAIASIDYLMLALACLVVARTYGLSLAALVVIGIGADLSGYEWIGGSMLRYLWVAASLMGVCAIQRDRPFAGGLLFGIAALTRLFPALFALGVVLHGAWKMIRGRAWDRSTLVFIGGLATATVALVLPSLIFLGGIEVWADYLSKLQLHTQPNFVNHVGLRGVMGDGDALSWARVVMVTLYLASIPRLGAAQAAIAGGALVYAFGFIGSYYYTFLVLLLLWQTAEESDVRHRVLCMSVLGVEAGVLALRLMSSHAVPIYDPLIYIAMSWAVGLLSLALFGSILVGWGEGRLEPARLEPDHGS